MSSTKFKLSAPIRPVSTNQAVRHGKNGSYKSTAFKVFQAEIFNELRKCEKQEILADSPVSLIIHFTLPKEEYFTKQGSIAKRHDLDNLLKYTIDAVAEYLGFNDAIVTGLVSAKVPGERWFIDVEVRQ